MPILNIILSIASLNIFLNFQVVGLIGKTVDTKWEVDVLKSNPLVKHYLAVTALHNNLIYFQELLARKQCGNNIQYVLLLAG